MILTAERERVDGSRTLNPGKHTYCVQNSSEQESVLFRSVISVTGRNDHRCQDVLCVEAGIGSQQSDKTCQQLPPNHYQGYGQGHFDGYEYTANPISSGNAGVGAQVLGR